MLTTNGVIDQIRALIDDRANPPDHSVVNENLGRNVYASTNLINGTNKAFRLNNRRLVDTSLSLTRDGVALVLTTDFTVDTVRGSVTIVTAAPTATLIAPQYDFLLFLDSDITIFLTKALNFIGYTDITTVPDGLDPALAQKAAAYAWRALASRTATQFDSGAGGKTINKSSIKKQYLELANAADKCAAEDLKNFYQRQGRRDAPSFGSFATKQSVYTPKR